MIEGDLIELAKFGRFDVIIHGCNCFCNMNAGFAKSIKFNFPEAYLADAQTIKGEKEKLGNYTTVTIQRNGFEFTIVNAYTQYYYGGSGVKVDYEAIKNIFKKIKKNYPGKRIAYPLIGAGLAGGNWSIIENIINNQLKGEHHTAIKYRQD